MLRATMANFTDPAYPFGGRNLNSLECSIKPSASTSVFHQLDSSRLLDEDRCNLTVAEFPLDRIVFAQRVIAYVAKSGQDMLKYSRVSPVWDEAICDYPGTWEPILKRPHLNQ